MNQNNGWRNNQQNLWWSRDQQDKADFVLLSFTFGVFFFVWLVFVCLFYSSFFRFRFFKFIYFFILCVFLVFFSFFFLHGKISFRTSHLKEKLMCDENQKNIKTTAMFWRGYKMSIYLVILEKKIGRKVFVMFFVVGNIFGSEIFQILYKSVHNSHGAFHFGKDTNPFFFIQLWGSSRTD